MGRALALLAQKAAVFDRVNLDELALDWDAAVLLLTEGADRPPPEGTLRARAKAFGKALSRKERKALEPFIPGLGTAAIDLAGFRDHVFATANRAGLLVSGDLGMTLRVLAGQASPSPADLQSEETLDVIRFAFSDRFSEVRGEVRQRDRVNTGP